MNDSQREWTVDRRGYIHGGSDLGFFEQTRREHNSRVTARRRKERFEIVKGSFLYLYYAYYVDPMTKGIDRFNLFVINQFKAGISLARRFGCLLNKCVQLLKQRIHHIDGTLESTKWMTLK